MDGTRRLPPHSAGRGQLRRALHRARRAFLHRLRGGSAPGPRGPTLTLTDVTSRSGGTPASRSLRPSHARPNTPAPRGAPHALPAQPPTADVSVTRPLAGPLQPRTCRQLGAEAGLIFGFRKRNDLDEICDQGTLACRSHGQAGLRQELHYGRRVKCDRTVFGQLEAVVLPPGCGPTTPREPGPGRRGLAHQGPGSDRAPPKKAQK